MIFNCSNSASCQTLLTRSLWRKMMMLVKAVAPVNRRLVARYPHQMQYSCSKTYWRRKKYVFRPRMFFTMDLNEFIHTVCNCCNRIRERLWQKLPWPILILIMSPLFPPVSIHPMQKTRVTNTPTMLTWCVDSMIIGNWWHQKIVCVLLLLSCFDVTKFNVPMRCADLMLDVPLSWHSNMVMSYT